MYDNVSFSSCCCVTKIIRPLLHHNSSALQVLKFLRKLGNKIARNEKSKKGAAEASCMTKLAMVHSRAGLNCVVEDSHILAQ